MRAHAAAMVLAVCAARAGVAHANDAGAEATVMVPFGDWAGQTGVGFGAGARVRVPLTAYTTITARVAAIDHLAREDAGLTVGLLELPLLGGVRYYVSAPARVRGFLAGEVGVVLRRTSISAGGSTDDEWRFFFGSSLGAGVEVGRLEVSAAVWLPDLAHVEHSAAAVVSVGATFACW